VDLPIKNYVFPYSYVATFTRGFFLTVLKAAWIFSSSQSVRHYQYRDSAQVLAIGQGILHRKDFHLEFVATTVHHLPRTRRAEGGQKGNPFGAWLMLLH
jgi:hypothetical protein